MAVRFLPPPSDENSPPGGDRSDLAEVIELRSLLTHAKWRAPGASSEKARSEDASLEAEPSETEPSEPEPSKTEPSEPEPSETEPTENQPFGASQHALAEPAEPSNVVRGRFGRKPDAPSSAGESAQLGEPGEESSTSVPERSANADGVRLLARKARSSGELRDDLLRLDHAPDEVEEVIADFEQSLYLDDCGLARVLTEKLRDTKRASRSQIRAKLRARKLSDSAIEAAIAELGDEDEFALLRSTAADRARTMRDLDRQTAERRLLGYLARRGWSGEPATRAVREALDSAGGSSQGRRGAAHRGGSGVRFH